MNQPRTEARGPRTLFVVLLLLLATSAFAQSSEFGHASGGDIDLITKHPRTLSGSLALTAGHGTGFGATLGGTLVKDRVWFFASADKSQPLFASQFGTSRATNAKITANLGDRQNLAAAFAASRQVGLTTDQNLSVTMPSSFLSLHYTGIVSNNMFVTATFSELKRSTTGY